MFAEVLFLAVMLLYQCNIVCHMVATLICHKDNIRSRKIPLIHQDRFLNSIENDNVQRVQ